MARKDRTLDPILMIDRIRTDPNQVMMATTDRILKKTANRILRMTTIDRIRKRTIDRIPRKLHTKTKVPSS